MAGTKVVGMSKEENINKLMSRYLEEVIQVIFTDTFSYHLKFLPRYRIPTQKEHRDHEGNFPAV